jgi:hypothetical protein
MVERFFRSGSTIEAMPIHETLARAAGRTA